MKQFISYVWNNSYGYYQKHSSELEAQSADATKQVEKMSHEMDHLQQMLLDSDSRTNWWKYNSLTVKDDYNDQQSILWSQSTALASQNGLLIIVSFTSISFRSLGAHHSSRGYFWMIQWSTEAVLCLHIIDCCSGSQNGLLIIVSSYYIIRLTAQHQ